MTNQNLLQNTELSKLLQMILSLTPRFTDCTRCVLSFLLETVKELGCQTKKSSISNKDIQCFSKQIRTCPKTFKGCFHQNMHLKIFQETRKTSNKEQRIWTNISMLLLEIFQAFLTKCGTKPLG